MSLDTVEIVMELERKLSLAFHDRDVEQVNTMGDMVEIACRLRGVVDDGGQLEEQLTKEVLAALKVAGIESEGLGRDAPFFKLFLSLSDEPWETFRRSLECDLPMPAVKFRKRMGVFYEVSPRYDYLELALSDVVRVVGIQRVISGQLPTPPICRYGVELVVFAVTTQQGGLDPYALRSWHSFANDLGLD